MRARAKIYKRINNINPYKGLAVQCALFIGLNVREAYVSNKMIIAYQPFFSRLFVITASSSAREANSKLALSLSYEPQIRGERYKRTLISA